VTNPTAEDEATEDEQQGEERKRSLREHAAAELFIWDTPDWGEVIPEALAEDLD